MAMFHLHGQIIKRSDGRSVVNAAAYRAGEALYDRRLKKGFDYRQKGDVEESVILAPDGAPAWIFDREQLWNAVEDAERRLNSQLAREFDVAISIELARKNPAAAKALVRQWATCLFVERGLIVDISFHGFGGRNPHAHVLATLRRLHPQALEFSEGSPFVFESHKARDLNDRRHMEFWRQCWADMSNAAMAAEGIDARIDHRTLIAQGIIDREPSIHFGPDANAMVRRGRASELWEENAEIQFANQEHRRRIERRYAAYLEARIAAEEKAARAELPDIEIERLLQEEQPSSQQSAKHHAAGRPVQEAIDWFVREEPYWQDNRAYLAWLEDVEARREKEREEAERLEAELDAARAIAARADDLDQMGLRLNEAMQTKLRRSRIRLNDAGPQLSSLIDDLYQRLHKAFGAAKTVFDRASSQIIATPSAVLDDLGSRLNQALDATQANAQTAAQREGLAAKVERDRQEAIEEFTKAVEDELVGHRLPVKFVSGCPIIDVAELPEERRMFANVFSARLQPWVNKIVDAAREQVIECAWANIDDVQEIRGSKTCWNEHVFPPRLRARALQLLNDDPALAGLPDQLRSFRKMGAGTPSASTVLAADGATAEKLRTPRAAELDREEDAAVDHQHHPWRQNGGAER